MVPAWLPWLAADTSPAVDALSPREWAAMVAAARTHHVASAFHLRLQACGLLDRVEPAARAALAQAHQAASFDTLIWRRALALVLPMLAEHGIVATPYKGAALAFGVYDDPAARSMSDIDLWLRADDMPRAGALLEARGFTPRGKDDRPLALQAMFDGETAYAGHAVGVPLVEMHWGVFPGEWLRRASRVDRDALRARLRPGTLAGTPVTLLAPEDHLIQVAVHAGITHVFSMATVRCLLDLVMLAQRGIDWHVVVTRAREWRLARVAGHALALAGDLFDRDAFRAASRELLTPRERAAAYRFVDPAAVLRGHALEGVAKWRFLLHCVDRPRDRALLVARSAWPERDWLDARYGRADAAIRARHLRNAMRGRF